jgi:tetratricopeptide (TPR) repeat protein
MWKVRGVVIMAMAGMAALSAMAHAQPAGADAKLAEALAQQAFDAYVKGDSVSALALYKRAYQASSAGTILFNIANIYDKKLGDKQQALDYYQQYLRSGDTDPDVVKRATERIEILRAELEAAQQAQGEARPTRSTAPSGTASPAAAPRVAIAPSPPPPPLAERGAGWRWAGLATAAVGLGGVGLGGVYGLIAKSKNDRAEAMCDGRVCPDWGGVALTEEARRAARVSTVGFVAGGVLVAGGIGIFLYAPRKQGARVDRASIRIAPGLGGLAVSGTWR